MKSMWRVALVLFVIAASLILLFRDVSVFSATLSDILIDDMSKPNEGKLHGVPDGYSWNIGPEVSGNAIPLQYNAIQGWGHMYEAATGNQATNTRIAIRNMETWWLSKSTNQWKRVQNSPNNVEGAAFVEDYSGNASTDPGIKMIDGYQTVRPGNGHNFHFWHAGGGYDIPPADRNDFGGVVTVYQARLVVDDPSRADDRAVAKYLASSALDLYFSRANHGTPPIPSLGIGRAKFITQDWTLFTFNSISKSNPDLIRNNPPPIEMPGGTSPSPSVSVSVQPSATPISPSPGTCPKKPQGDTDCNGLITLADFAKWKQEFTGALTTKNADFNGDGQVKLADFQIWRRSFISIVNPTAVPTAPPGNTACIGGPNVTLKVMPLGDSVTGGTWQLGYRGPLQQKMKDANIKFDFVGNRGQVRPQDWVDWAGRGMPGMWYGTDGSEDAAAAANPTIDSDYEGHGGFQAGQPRSVVGYSDHMLAQMVPWDIPTHKPDIVLMHIGTNDVYGGWSHHGAWGVGGTVKNVLDLVDTLHRLKPDMWIIVSALGDTAVNTGVEPGIAQRISQGRRIKYAKEMYTNFGPADLSSSDNVHPTESGYRKMADVWYAQVNPLLCK